MSFKIMPTRNIGHRISFQLEKLVVGNNKNNTFTKSSKSGIFKLTNRLYSGITILTKILRAFIYSEKWF